MSARMTKIIATMNWPPRAALAERATNSGGGPAGPAPGAAGVPGPAMAGWSPGWLAALTIGGGWDVKAIIFLTTGACTRFANAKVIRNRTMARPTHRSTSGL